MRSGYDRVDGGIGRSYDEIKGVTMSVSRDFHMLGKITTGKMVKKLDCIGLYVKIVLKLLIIFSID